MGVEPRRTKSTTTLRYVPYHLAVKAYENSDHCTFIFYSININYSKNIATFTFHN